MWKLQPAPGEAPGPELVENPPFGRATGEAAAGAVLGALPKWLLANFLELHGALRRQSRWRRSFLK